MIKITTIKVSNFRSFKMEKNIISSLKKINIMVGKNNVGKTNLLRAIFLFFHPYAYDCEIDRNHIKKITGGGSADAKIIISFDDDESIINQLTQYKIICDFNKDEVNRYRLDTPNEEMKKKLGNSKKIEEFLGDKFKCVFLSTTDEDINSQSDQLISDLILRFYTKQSKAVKKSIERFESSYKELTTAFKDNISGIELKLKKQFEEIDDIPVKPRLELNPNKDITSFLLENIRLKLDDDYAQDIGLKGAGIQRVSLILLTLYLLSEIYKNENKIILLDEPEAFLYPLLERELKDKLEKTVYSDEKMQIFMTSHSRTYLKELSNTQYKFAYLTQAKEIKEYKRSKNEQDINKYTCIEEMCRKNKYEILKNYGLLDEIDDYEYVIICEGQTDSNYLKKILEGKEFIPQIRFGINSDGAYGISKDLNYKNIGSGADAIISILIYLDKISSIQRKVFVLLDGDEKGCEVRSKIKPSEFKNLILHIKILDKNKEIEDMVFEKNYFANRVLQYTPELMPYKDSYISVIEKINEKKSVITQTEDFIKGNGIDGVDIKNIKHHISLELEKAKVEKDFILCELEDFFYND
jgi:hypothetical protein